MDKIPRLVEQLQSPNKDTRYEACEWLRAAPSLPAEALAALEAAALDPDPLVADSARRAIALHAASEAPTLPPAAIPPAATSLLDRPFLAGPAAALGSYALIALLALLLGAPYSPSFALVVCLMGAPAPILLGLLCAALARFARKPGQAAAIAGAVTGSAAGLLAALVGGMPE